MVGKRCHTARNRPASPPLPTDLKRFAAKHADVALSANLASKDFVRIAVGIMPRARNALEKRFWVGDTGAPPDPLFLSSKNRALQAQKSGSSVPLNVLGGYRWPNAVCVERDLLCKIIRAE